MVLHLAVQVHAGTRSRMLQWLQLRVCGVDDHTLMTQRPGFCMQAIPIGSCSVLRFM